LTPKKTHFSRSFIRMIGQYIKIVSGM
jgi:hypothetical protein